MGYLVDTNQRLVFFVREASDELKSIGVLDERASIHDTWKSRDCTYSCAGVVDDTYASCFGAPADKLVLVTVNCSRGLCLVDLAGLCDQHIGPSLDACTEARANATGLRPVDMVPNFIMADWVQARGDIVGNVRAANSWILQENGFPVSTAKVARGSTSREGQGISESAWRTMVGVYR